MSDEKSDTLRLNSPEAGKTRFGPAAVLRHRYQLDSELGRGGMGIVYRATDLELKRQVAVKLLPDRVSSAEARERFLREARAAAALNHPNIVAVYDVGEDQGVPFFVMELVEGCSLGQIPSRDFRRVVEIALQICQALEHAHTHNIVHRDLKPDNVLLSGTGASGSVKLADLGLAFTVRDSRLSGAGLLVGTPAYMAPEQILGQKIDGRVDLYALGVLLYEMTTGRVPFIGADPLTVVSQHIHAPVVPPRALRSDIPLALEAVIVRLLAKDPAQRFPSASDTALALRRVLKAPDSGSDDESAAAVAILDALSRGRLVGRAEELAEARELWRRAREGRGHCLLLSGEPGAGKTRLARELVVQAAVDGAVVLSGACYEYEATTPYLPVVDAFRRWVREQTHDEKLQKVLGDAAPQLAKLAPEIESRLGPFPIVAGLPPHEERLLFFDAIVQVFTELAGSRGLLFYIDDLHWADASTLWLVGHLLRNLRETSVLVVASYREIELDRAHPLAKALVDWNRERLMTRIVLRRFGADETREQLGALLNEPVSEEFAEAVHRETEGNPFFVEEVLKALIDQGSVCRKSGQWIQGEVADLIIPQSVKEAIGSRLDGVSPACNEILRAAAVVGKKFTFEELVAAVGGENEETLLDALDEATSAQLLAAESGELFTFTHDKIREVLYEELNPIRRRRLHRRTAEGLERHRERTLVAVETLAHHYIEAGDHERGLGYAKQAAKAAETIFAFDEAIAAYGRALECAESLGLQNEQAVLEESIGNASSVGGNQISASEHFERALLLARDPLQRARLQCEAASALVVNGNPRGLDLLHDALTVLNPETHPMETANALTVEGRFHHLAGQHRKAIELIEKAAALAAPKAEGSSLSVFEASTLTLLYPYLAGAHQHLGRFADSDRWARRAIEFGRKHRVAFAEALGTEFLGENSLNTGNWEEGLEYATIEREIAGRIHSRERKAWTHLYGGLCAWQLGDAQRAEHEFKEGFALAEAVGEMRVASLLLSYTAITFTELGEPDRALELGLESLARAKAIGLLYMQTEAHRCLACVRFKRRELDEAVRLSERVLELTAGTDSRSSRLWSGPVHVRALLALGRRDEARKQLTTYAEMVADCQSPHFSREVTRLETMIG